MLIARIHTKGANVFISNHLYEIELFIGNSGLREALIALILTHHANEISLSGTPAKWSESSCRRAGGRSRDHNPVTSKLLLNGLKGGIHAQHELCIWYHGAGDQKRNTGMLSDAPSRRRHGCPAQAYLHGLGNKARRSDSALVNARRLVCTSIVCPQSRKRKSVHAGRLKRCSRLPGKKATI